jgi:quercetin dioxygenase-like cupin family protein
VEIARVPRFDWTPLPREGCWKVDGKVLLVEGDFHVAMLRFGKNGAIDEHATGADVDVICLEGKGFTSVGGESVELEAGQRVRWPAGVPHGLWTEGTKMVTLMVHRAANFGAASAS